LIPARSKRWAADSASWWRREWVRSNLEATERALWEGKLAATWWRAAVSVVAISIVVLVRKIIVFVVFVNGVKDWELREVFIGIENGV